MAAKTTRRMMILTEGKLGVFSSKTATSIIRYCPDEVVCVLDSVAARSGKALKEFIGVGDGIPIVAHVKDGLAHKPTQLVIGIAPVGGKLPDAWRAITLEAIGAGLDIVNGLHHILGEDPEFAAAAKKKNVRIFDVRQSPPVDVTQDRLHDLKQRRIAVVGSDCNIGKMVTAIEVDRELRRRGRDSEFVATGQTGIMIAGSGIAVDHVLSDYVNGAAEQLCWDRREREIVVIEGQGSVYHPAYSAVTVGLLHGCLPHAILFQHAPLRTHVSHYERFKIPPLKSMLQLVENLMQPLQLARIAAVTLNTVGMSDADAQRSVEAIESETGLPAADPIRHGSQKIVDAVEHILNN